MPHMIGAVLGLVGVMQLGHLLGYSVPAWLWLIFDLFLAALLFCVWVNERDFHRLCVQLDKLRSDTRNAERKHEQQLRKLREKLRKEVPVFPNSEDEGEASRADRPSPLRE